jgi:hypothetical protein
MSEVAINGIKKTVHGAGGINSQMTQIYIDYASLPSIREITLDEVRFFYRSLIDGLIELQQARAKSKARKGG